GDLWVADTRDHVIVRVDSNKVSTVIAGAMGTPGTNDALIATDGRLSLPSGLLWVSTATGLLISDTGNNTVRRLYFNNDLQTWSLETAAGVAGQAGQVDGSPATAKFNAPIGLCSDVLNSGFYVVDRAGNALRRLQTSAPQPPVPEPVVGFVSFEFSQDKGEYLSVFNNIAQAVFNNPTVIAIKAQVGTQTFITYGATPANSFEDTIPAPNPQTGTSPTIYRGDGLSADETAPSITPIFSDITIKSIGMASGRRPSSIVTNRYQFQVANPSFSGDNAASFSFQEITTNAALYYTIDGSDPTNGNVGSSIGPVSSGQKISLPIVTNTTIKVRGYLNNFLPSQVVTKVFSVTNFNANKITFGFQNGEASSDFVAAAGQKFYAPVTLTLLPGETIYSLQFNVTVTNILGSPAPIPNAYDFKSMLLGLIPGTKPPEYFVIPPAMFNGTQLTNLIITNTSENLLGVGWFERFGKTNLYDASKQTLITYSQAHNNLFPGGGGKIIVGGYSFIVPPAAANGQQYQIQLGRPSGTADGIAEPTFILAPTNGSLGNGAINAVKNVTVGSRQYLVGDCVPFRWFNAGDFGDTNLVNSDISDLFQGVVYGLNRPPEGSDFFDCMDSSDGTYNGVLDGNDTLINNIQFGDKVLDVSDIYVTYRRSLDPSLVWYARYWSNGALNAVVVPNVASGGAQPSIQSQSRVAPHIASGPRFVNVAPDDIVGAPGASVQVPVRASIVGNLPIRVMAMNVEVQSLDGSPVISVPVSFTPAAGLGAPTVSDSHEPNNFAGAWLNSGAAGVSGTNVLGTLTVTLPTNATASSAWIVHFSHLSVSPNGIGLFPLTMQDALITTANRSTSSWGDGIPDSWRLRWFGSVSNLLSGANLDPDGDGHSNFAEFKAGTNPLGAGSYLNVTCLGGAPRSALMWPSVFGKQYTIESSSTLFGGSWSTIGTNVPGTGQPLQFADPNPANAMRFYRVKVQ
ncbi:MAG: hypothetical protein JWO95_2112, partial [Verrucomicrobiales bacterium]|nr:hypothetical protein [Verrucomicrobiales bacterium]